MWDTFIIKPFISALLFIYDLIGKILGWRSFCSPFWLN